MGTKFRQDLVNLFRPYPTGRGPEVYVGTDTNPEGEVFLEVWSSAGYLPSESDLLGKAAGFRNRWGIEDYWYTRGANRWVAYSFVPTRRTNLLRVIREQVQIDYRVGGVVERAALAPRSGKWMVHARKPGEPWEARAFLGEGELVARILGNGRT